MAPSVLRRLRGKEARQDKLNILCPWGYDGGDMKIILVLVLCLAWHRVACCLYRILRSVEGVGE